MIKNHQTKSNTLLDNTTFQYTIKGSIKMSNITASMVASLREVTGLGMMDCKKALVEANGDLKKAEEIIRIKSGAKAGKMAGRIAAEGVVIAQMDSTNQHGVLVEINCETDFVAKDDSFIAFANLIASTILITHPKTVEELQNTKLSSGKSLEEERREIVAKLGENIMLRRFELINTNGHIATYLHGKKIGVMIDIEGGDNELGRDLAMHIAASKPICVSKENVSQDKIEAERNIYIQQASQSGKPADIVTKMVDGRINKYLAEITLLGQPFVKNPDITVEKLLSTKNAKVNSFVMFVVGEGMGKKVVDFAAEVAAASIIN